MIEPVLRKPPPKPQLKDSDSECESEALSIDTELDEYDPIAASI